jgi:DNA repair protein RecN (Recombination protein N)
VISELRVRELGVIEDVEVVLGPGLTVISGETGAGKTLIVEALELLLGARADPTMVRHGATESLIEGRFVDDEQELVLARTVPAEGRSRAYVDGKMAPVARLEELGRELVDLHGQHAHQSLLHPAAQRRALDSYLGVDLETLIELRQRLRDVDQRLGPLGGPSGPRDRELDLLRFELNEIEAAGISSGEEDAELAAEEEILGEAETLRSAAAHALELLDDSGPDSVLDRLGIVIEALGRRGPLAAHEGRLRGLVAELTDAAADLRRDVDRFEEDPGRLATIQERRHELGRLVRKHGSELADVLRAADEAHARIVELEATDERRHALEGERRTLVGQVATEEEAIGTKRRAGAARFAAAVEANLRVLALPHARLEVELPPTGLADEMTLLLGANPGEPALPLAKVASGGELARTMLALRLVLTAAPPTLVFDEVDAGIGGEVAIAVGRSLAALARTHQVLVVTHLAQVAAHADHQFVVEKSEANGRTRSRLYRVDGDERLIELSRMLSGQPGSASARRHAAELLADAHAS